MLKIYVTNLCKFIYLFIFFVSLLQDIIFMKFVNLLPDGTVTFSFGTVVVLSSLVTVGSKLSDGWLVT